MEFGLEFISFFIELAEGKPPYADIHPMRAIFMIPTKPPPSFRDPNKWSLDFIDFVSKCLIKNPQNRTSATELLHHNFVKNAKPIVLKSIIEDARIVQENFTNLNENLNEDNFNEEDNGTLTRKTINHENGFDTIKSDQINSNTIVDIGSSLGTMVVNEDNQEYNEEDNSTLKIKDQQIKRQDNRHHIPQYIQHYSNNTINEENGKIFIKEFYNIDSLHLQNEVKLFETDTSFINKFNAYDIELRLKLIDEEMSKELEIIKKKYEIKRAPIIEAIELKKRKPQIF